MYMEDYCTLDEKEFGIDKQIMLHNFKSLLIVLKQIFHIFCCTYLSFCQLLHGFLRNCEKEAKLFLDIT